MKNSLQYRLTVWLAACLLVVGAIAGFIAFLGAFHEAYEFQDDQLIQVAALINSQSLSVANGDIPRTVIKDNDSRLTVQMLGSQERQTLALPSALPNGFQTQDVSGSSWRLYVRTLADGRQIAVGQSTEGRDEIARDSGLRTAMPFLILLPLLITLVVVTIRKTLAPVERLSAEIDTRGKNDPSDLSPLDIDSAPQEIKPFLLSINRLFARLTNALAEQRRFIADAAHELRSPITALLLQAENVERVALNPEASQRLAKLKAGLLRARSLLEQLLTMARVQANPLDQVEDLLLRDVIRQVLEDSFILADAKAIEIQLTGDSGPAVMRATKTDAITLFRNILDNAIRYTPRSGKVEVRVRADSDRLIVDITDTGPGIAEQDKARVFDPFYRATGTDEFGSGLGLSIVKTITERLRGSISLHDVSAAAPHGLRVHISLPRGDLRTRR